MMGDVLTLDEAAERLIPTITAEDEQQPASTEGREPVKRSGKWLSLEDGAAALMERMKEPEGKQTAKPTKAPRKPSETMTVAEAAKELVTPDDEDDGPYADETESATRRNHAIKAIQAATVKQASIALSLEAFVANVAQDFPDVGGLEDVYNLDTARGAQFVQAQTHCKALGDALEQAWRDEQNAIQELFRVEDETFQARHPDWSEEDATRVYEMLSGTGLPDDEITRLWTSTIAIDINDPRAVAVVKMAAGDEQADGDRIVETLKAVGFTREEIEAVSHGRPVAVHLRDHRVQELLYRASRHADEAPEDQEAA